MPRIGWQSDLHGKMNINVIFYKEYIYIFLNPSCFVFHVFLKAWRKCATLAIHTRTGPPADRHQIGLQMALLLGGQFVKTRPGQGREKGRNMTKQNGL